MKCKGKVRWSQVIISVLISYSLFSRMGIPELPEQLYVNGIFAMIYNVLNAFAFSLYNKTILITGSFIVCYLFTCWLNKHAYNNHWCIAVIMATIHTLIKTYLYFNNLYDAFMNEAQLLIVLCNFIGFIIIFNYMSVLTEIVSDYLENNNIRIDLKNGKIKDVYSRHPYITVWVILLCAWVIHIAIKYPGAMTSDNWGQLTQYNGMFPMNAHWPPFHTMLLGLFVYTGDKIVSTSFGLFMYVVMQWLVISAIMAYSIETMRKHNMNRILRITTLILYCVSPIFAGYVGVVEKDVLYGAFFVLFIIQIIEYLLNRDLFWGWKNIILLIISGAMVGLLRKNGNYVILPTLLVLIFDYLIYAVRSKIKFKQAVKVIILIIPFILSVEINHLIIVDNDIKPGGIAEALSMPIQQTARYMTKYQNELSENDMEILSHVFENVDEISGRYQPDISDPVKDIFINDASKDDLIQFLNLWIRNFMRHPLIYIEASVAQNYYLFDMNNEYNNYYYRDFHMAGEDRIEFTEIQWLQPLQDIVIVYYRLLHSIPVLGLLASRAFYVNLFIIILGLAIRGKKNNIVLVSIPFVLSILIVILGPVVATRYVLQIMYATPLYIAYCQKIRGEVEE